MHIAILVHLVTILMNIPNIFKKNEDLIYMSKPMEIKKFYKAWRQVCIYSFQETNYYYLTK